MIAESPDESRDYPLAIECRNLRSHRYLGPDCSGREEGRGRALSQVYSWPFWRPGSRDQLWVACSE